jgi:hypothetical protein
MPLFPPLAEDIAFKTARNNLSRKPVGFSTELDERTTLFFSRRK